MVYFLKNKKNSVFYKSSTGADLLLSWSKCSEMLYNKEPPSELPVYISIIKVLRSPALRSLFNSVLDKLTWPPDLCHGTPKSVPQFFKCPSRQVLQIQIFRHLGGVSVGSSLLRSPLQKGLPGRGFLNQATPLLLLRAALCHNLIVFLLSSPPERMLREDSDLVTPVSPALSTILPDR